MRHTPFDRCLVGGGVRFAGFALALVLLSCPQARAQGSSSESASVARYIPRDDLVVYAEFAGLNAHSEAWQKTAAYKMLNETPLGAMLEDVGTQLADQALAKAPAKRVTGAEVVMLVKHAFRSGFAFGINAKKDQQDPSSMVLVLRGGARKEVRAPVSKALLSFGGKAGKPKLASKGGDRTVAVMPSDTRAEGWAWWAEKDDVVIVLDKPETVDAIIEVIEGKKPNAVDHPIRTELSQNANGFLPVGLGFLDSGNAPALKGAGDQAKEQLAGLQRIAYQWGFQDNALMTVWRLSAPAPRQGALALFDGPKFDLKSVPPLAEGVEGFTVVSLDLAHTYDTLLALANAANPQADAQAGGVVDTLKTKYKIDLRKDVLSQLGPKMAYCVLPGKLTATSDKAESKPAGGVPNPLTMMLAAVQVPKFAVMIETKNATAFSKKLDELIIAANKMLRESAKPAAPAGAENAGEGGAAGAPADRKRASASAAPSAPQFQPVGGRTKAYALALPPEMGKLPAGVKPTIRVGEKYVVIGVNPAVAQQALAAKEAWKPSGDFETALASVPAGLVLLNVSDPRGTMPQELASLPRTLQTALNTAVQAAALGTAPGARGATPGFPGAPAGVPGAPPGSSSSSGPPSGSSRAERDSATSPPSAVGPPGAPNFLGGSGAMPGEGSGAPAAAIVLRVDPSKMPTADALKPFLFPGYAALTVNDQEIRFVTREAFPNIASGGGASSPGASALMGPAMQKVREAAMKRAGAQAKGSSPAPASAGEKPK